MKHLFAYLFAFSVCFAASPVGDWHGTLKTQGPELRLALHVLPASGGGYTATIDSIDQGAKGIPVSRATFEGQRLKLSLDTIKASYEGDLSADGKTLTGTWSQGGSSMPLVFRPAGTETKTAEDPGQSATVAPLLGVWEGVLDAGSSKLRVRFTLVKDAKGKLVGGFDSIDQGSNGIPISGLSLSGSKFHFDLRGVGGKYDGDVSEDKQSINGTWKQGDAELPLVWKKVK